MGRIELRAAKVGSAEFQRDFAKMVQNASILSFPFFLGTAALAPSLFHLMAQTTMAGRHCSFAAHPTRRRADGIVLQF